MAVAKPRILILENSLYTTGALKAILSAAESLKHAFEFVFVIDIRSENGSHLSSLGYRVHRMPFLELSKSAKALLYLPRLWTNARRLLRIARTEEAVVIHVNDVYNLVGAAAKMMQPRLKLVYHVRLLKASYIRAMYPLFAGVVRRYADRIIAVSQAVRQDLGDIPQASVIYDAPALPEKHPEWSGFRAPAQSRVFYLGNYMPGKGQDLGLEAFLLLRERFPGVSLHFAGGTHTPAARAFRDMLQARAETAGAAAQISFGEAVSDIEQAMKAHDIVLNLSESESFSFVCLEALKYGVPLVASDCGGPAEITGNGKRAALVPNRDPVAAAEALAEIISQPAVTKRLAADSRIWARDFFSSTRATEQLAAVYSSLLKA